MLAGELYLRPAVEENLLDRIRVDLFARLSLVEQAAAGQRDRERAHWDALADELGPRAHGRVTFIDGNGRPAGGAAAGSPARRCLADEPGCWSTLREFSLPAWPCRCAGTCSLPVDDDFSLRAIGCPIRLRHDGRQHYARVIEDCGRCAFFVGIGYLGADRRRIQLRCGFGAPPLERHPPLRVPSIELPPRLQTVAGS